MEEDLCAILSCYSMDLMIHFEEADVRLSCLSLKAKKARMLIRIRVAKERLYEAKVGVIELQTRWDKPGHGG